MVSPALIASFFRTSAFRGKRYESDFLSGKIDVFQLVLPIVARTGNDPQPLLECPKKKSMSFLVFLEILTKCQGASPGYSHTLARTTNVFVIAYIFSVYYTPIFWLIWEHINFHPRGGITSHKKLMSKDDIKL